MGYYTKHIFKIVGEHTTEDLVKLANAIYKGTTYDFNVYPDLDCIDDRTWNCGAGAKLYNLDNTLKKVCELVPDINFTIDCHGEEGNEYTYICDNGNISTTSHTEWDPEYQYFKKIDEYPKIDYDISQGECPDNCIRI